MNDDQLDDLKQFIEATVSQTETRLGEKIETVETDVKTLKTDVKTLQTDVKILRQEMNDGFAGVGEAIDEIHTQIDVRGSVA